jgi:hypothetical protein
MRAETEWPLSTRYRDSVLPICAVRPNGWGARLRSGALFESFPLGADRIEFDSSPDRSPNVICISFSELGFPSPVSALTYAYQLPSLRRRYPGQGPQKGDRSTLVGQVTPAMTQESALISVCQIAWCALGMNSTRCSLESPNFVLDLGSTKALQQCNAMQCIQAEVRVCCSSSDPFGRGRCVARRCDSVFVR